MCFKTFLNLFLKTVFIILHQFCPSFAGIPFRLVRIERCDEWTAASRYGQLESGAESAG